MGRNPKTNEQTKADFDKQKRKDAIQWSNACDRNIKAIFKSLKTIEVEHKALIDNRFEMEAALGRSFDGKSEVIPKGMIKSQMDSKFLNLKQLKEAVKAGTAETKKEAQQLLVRE